MQTFLELLLVTGRILTILPLFLLVTMMMGKRAIGELPIFDVLTVITLGAVVGADIADPKVEHIHTVYAIILIGIFNRLVAKLKIYKRNIGKWITFEPTVIIYEGKILHKNLQKIQFTIDNVLSMLREKSIFDIDDVQLAIVEANGALSVLKKPLKNTVTLEDMNMSKSVSSISFPVIVDGKLYTSILSELGTDQSWLRTELQKRGVTSIENVFLATLNQEHILQVTLKNNNFIYYPTINH